MRCTDWVEILIALFQVCTGQWYMYSTDSFSRTYSTDMPMLYQSYLHY